MLWCKSEVSFWRPTVASSHREREIGNLAYYGLSCRFNLRQNDKIDWHFKQNKKVRTHVEFNQGLEDSKLLTYQMSWGKMCFPTKGWMWQLYLLKLMKLYIQHSRYNYEIRKKE